MRKIIILLIISSFFLSLIPLVNATPDYIIDDDIVYIDDSNVYLSANPHTLDKSGWVEFQLISKNYEGLIDVIFGFNTSSSKPVCAEIWKNENWEDLNRSFDVLNYDYQNFNKWYILNDVDINKNQLYKLRCFIYAKRGTDGKYFYGVKPSSETFIEAINNNHFYFIDPWWNITYEDIEGHWHLNELTGNNALDSSPNHYNGSLINMENEDWVTGKLNNSLQFDGVDEYIDCGNIAGFERNEAFSIEGWIKTSSSSGNKKIVSRRLNSGSYCGWDLSLDANGQIVVVLMHDSSTNAIWVTTTGSALNDDIYHHIIFTYDGSSLASGIHIYVDNFSISLNINSDSLTDTIIAPLNCQISGRDGANACFQGRIDEVLIYNKELTQAEVEFRYNDGNGRESIEQIIYGNPPNKPISIKPIDKSLDVNINTNLKTKVIDIDNDDMNVSFYLDDVFLEKIIGISNNTIVESSNLSLEYSMMYNWYVIVEDGHYSTQSDTFLFATEHEPDPIIPNVPPEKPLLVFPNNNEINVSKFIKLLSYVNDADDDILYVSFYWEDNSEIQSLFSITNYTVRTDRLELEYNTTYSWYVIVTDFIDFNVSDIFTFTTETEPEDDDDDISPIISSETNYTILSIGIGLAILVFVLEFLSNKFKIKKSNLLSIVELFLILIIITIMIFLKVG